MAAVFISSLPKHSQTYLDYRAKAESHSRHFPVQSVPFSYCKFPTENPLNFAKRITKLSILVSVAQIAKTLLRTDWRVVRAQDP